MPQLDVVAYEAEVLWLLGVFFMVYLLVLSNGLPRIYKILLYRLNRIKQDYNSVYTKQIENKVSLEVVQDNLNSGVRKEKQVRSDKYRLCQVWVDGRYNYNNWMWEQKGKGLGLFNYNRSLEELCCILVKEKK